MIIYGGCYFGDVHGINAYRIYRLLYKKWRKLMYKKIFCVMIVLIAVTSISCVCATSDAKNCSLESNEICLNNSAFSENNVPLDDEIICNNSDFVENNATLVNEINSTPYENFDISNKFINFISYEDQSDENDYVMLIDLETNLLSIDSKCPENSNIVFLAINGGNHFFITIPDSLHQIHIPTLLYTNNVPEGNYKIKLEIDFPDNTHYELPFNMEYKDGNVKIECNDYHYQIENDYCEIVAIGVNW